MVRSFSLTLILSLAASSEQQLSGEGAMVGLVRVSRKRQPSSRPTTMATPSLPRRTCLGRGFVPRPPLASPAHTSVLSSPTLSLSASTRLSLTTAIADTSLLDNSPSTVTPSAASARPAADDEACRIPSRSRPLQSVRVSRGRGAGDVVLGSRIVTGCQTPMLRSSTHHTLPVSYTHLTLPTKA